MIPRESHMVYALRHNEIVHISEVKRGLACNCTCPACHARLVAKKGSKRIAHFAHYGANECQYGYETSLHFAAKKLIQERKKFFIPPVYLRFPNMNKKEDLLYEARNITVDKVELEHREGNIIPDVVLYINGRKLYIEIYVTHAVDNIKAKKIQERGISTVEIDLSSYKKEMTEADLEQELFEEYEHKKWIYNKHEIEKLNEYKMDAIKLKCVNSRINNCIVGNVCPKQKYVEEKIGVYGSKLSKHSIRMVLREIIGQGCLECRACIEIDNEKTWCDWRKNHIQEEQNLDASLEKCIDEYLIKEKRKLRLKEKEELSHYESYDVVNFNYKFSSKQDKHVRFCPFKFMIYRDRIPTKNYRAKCNYCKFFKGVVDSYVICSYKKEDDNFGDIDKFQRDLVVNIKEQKICPSCGAELKMVVKNNHTKYFRCVNYPICSCVVAVNIEKDKVSFFNP